MAFSMGRGEERGERSEARARLRRCRRNLRPAGARRGGQATRVRRAAIERTRRGGGDRPPRDLYRAGRGYPGHFGEKGFTG
jgi:hypothetical protein